MVIIETMFFSIIHRKSKRHLLTFPTPFGRVTNSMEIWGGKSGMWNYVRVERKHFVEPARGQAVIHPRGTVRQEGVKGSEEDAQLSELPRDVGEDLLAGPAGGEHLGEAGVAPLEESEHYVGEVFGDRPPDVLPALDCAADLAPLTLTRNAHSLDS